MAHYARVAGGSDGKTSSLAVCDTFHVTTSTTVKQTWCPTGKLVSELVSTSFCAVVLLLFFVLCLQHDLFQRQIHE